MSVCPSRNVAPFLDAHHYLGATGRGFAWSDELGVIVLAKPTARRLPQDGTWLELVRWCLVGERNGGSRQWSRVSKWLRSEMPHVTTVVSYSDPSQGHTGSLYRACNWEWRPTWHRLRPPPSGNGSWKDGASQSVKDRWVFSLRRDERRDEILRVKDDSAIRAAMAPFALVSTEDGSPDDPIALNAATREPVRKPHRTTLNDLGQTGEPEGGLVLEPTAPDDRRPPGKTALPPEPGAVGSTSATKGPA